MNTKHKKITKNNSGATAIEFAVAFPIFIFFFLGVLEFSLVAWGNSMMDNMLTQVARKGMVGCIRGESFYNEESKQIECVNGYSVEPVQLRRDIQIRSAGIIRACDSSRFQLEAAPSRNFSESDITPGVVNLGQGSETVVYRMRYQWPVFFPIFKIPGLFGEFVDYEVVTVVRNEPFSGNGGQRIAGSGGC